MIKNNKPFFSVVTISFNQEKYIKDCIESVLAQSYDDFEYIIQDPGSKDNSRDIIRSFNSDKLRFYFEKDDSPAQGLNKGFSKASGKFFLFLNSDDVLLKDGLKILNEIILQNPSFDIYSGGAQIINEKGLKLRETFSDNFNLHMAAYGHSILVQPSTTFRASLFKSVGGFNERNLCCWDGELFIDFALNNANFYTTKNIISKFRITSDSITGSGKFTKLIKEYHKKMFRKILKKEVNIFYFINSFIFKFIRKFLNFDDTLNRIFFGKIYMRKSSFLKFIRKFIKTLLVFYF